MNDVGVAVVSEEVSDQAIEWFVRLRAEDVTISERDAFSNWLRASRTNQYAFVDILKLWRDLSVVKKMDFEELRHYPVLWEMRGQLGLKA